MPAHTPAGETPHATEAHAETTDQAGTRAAAAPGQHGAPHVSHGNTQDAWTGVVILLLGALLVCIGMMRDTMWLWVAGAVICLAGVVAWIGMHRAGMTKELW